jgi:hypothetical protein
MKTIKIFWFRIKCTYYYYKQLRNHEWTIWDCWVHSNCLTDQELWELTDGCGSAYDYILEEMSYWEE